eukprot:1937701-Pyramimonas_sp.AAC.1
MKRRPPRGSWSRRSRDTSAVGDALGPKGAAQLPSTERACPAQCKRAFRRQGRRAAPSWPPGPGRGDASRLFAGPRNGAISSRPRRQRRVARRGAATQPRRAGLARCARGQRGGSAALQALENSLEGEAQPPRARRA